MTNWRFKITYNELFHPRFPGILPLYVASLLVAISLVLMVGLEAAVEKLNGTRDLQCTFHERLRVHSQVMTSEVEVFR